MFSPTIIVFIPSFWLTMIMLYIANKLNSWSGKWEATTVTRLLWLSLPVVQEALALRLFQWAQDYPTNKKGKNCKALCLWYVHNFLVGKTSFFCSVFPLFSSHFIDLFPDDCYGLCSLKTMCLPLKCKAGDNYLSIYDKKQLLEPNKHAIDTHSTWCLMQTWCKYECKSKTNKKFESARIVDQCLLI